MKKKVRKQEKRINSRLGLETCGFLQSVRPWSKYQIPNALIHFLPYNGNILIELQPFEVASWWCWAALYLHGVKPITVSQFVFFSFRPHLQTRKASQYFFSVNAAGPFQCLHGKSIKVRYRPRLRVMRDVNVQGIRGRLSERTAQTSKRWRSWGSKARLEGDRHYHCVRGEQ